jgi:hypothetical protein
MIYYRMLALGYALDAEIRHVREETENWGREVGSYLKFAGVNVPAPWCAAFVYSMVYSGYALQGLPTPLKPVHNHAYVQSYADYARAHGMVVPATYVHPGDIVCFDFQKDGHFDHIGLVITPPDANGNFKAVEGNTNDEGSREGFEVAIRRRNVKKDGALFINYDTGAMYEGTIPERVAEGLRRHSLIG